MQQPPMSAKRGTETVDVTVDKGGRIKTEPPQ
jgi:hypothetical protein